jgi:hypothetical protein
MAMCGPTYQFPAFDIDSEPGSVGPRWKKWTQRFENYLVALDLTDAARKKATMLHFACERVHDIYDTKAEDGDDYDAVKGKLDTYFTPKKNVQFEIYTFRSAEQADEGHPNESVDDYATRLRGLAKNCEFANVENEIKAQIIQKCSSSRLRRRALRQPDQSLDDLLDMNRTLVGSDMQAAGIEKKKTVNKLRTDNRPPPFSKGKQSTNTGNREFHNQPNECGNCGGAWPHKNGRQGCPAFGKKCNNCERLNHYERCCRSKPGSGTSSRPRESRKFSKPRRRVNQVNTPVDDDSDSSASEDGYVYVMNVTKPGKSVLVEVTIDNAKVKLMIDSGASVNILDEQAYYAIKPAPKLQRDKIKIYPYGSQTPLSVLGKFTGVIESKRKMSNTTFYVVKGNSGSLLSYDTASELELITINAIHKQIKSEGNTLRKVEIVEKFPGLFTGIGKLKNFQVKLHIDESVQPSKQTHRRIPFHIRKQAETEIKNLHDADILEQVEGPTPWVSPAVIVPKPKDPKKVRICIDMREANQAIQRERHITPTMDGIMSDLNGATVFSKLDLRAGYHQLELHPESRYITTFSTHIGLFRYKRLNFGISSASEVFQNAIRQVLAGIPGQFNISDDIFVYGFGQADHNANLMSVLERLQENGLTLNKENVSSIKRGSTSMVTHSRTKECLQTPRK